MKNQLKLQSQNTQFVVSIFTQSQIEIGTQITYMCQNQHQELKGCTSEYLLCIELIGLPPLRHFYWVLWLYRRRLENSSKLIPSLFAHCRTTDGDGGLLYGGYYLFNKRRHLFVCRVLNQCTEALALCPSRYLSEMYTPSQIRARQGASIPLCICIRDQKILNGTSTMQVGMTNSEITIAQKFQKSKENPMTIMMMIQPTHGCQGSVVFLYDD